MAGTGGVPARRSGALDRCLELGHLALERLAVETDSVPAANQIEVHPYLTNDAVRAYGREHDILTRCWSPLAKARTLTDPIVVDIAAWIGRMPSQVTLRWHIERGDVVFPKTMSTARMHENLDIFAFQLDADDQAAI